MKLPRREFLHLAAAAATLPVISSIALAVDYPTRPITIVVPFPAGGPTDALGRVLADRMRRALNEPVIVENVTGAAGTIGTAHVARAVPDEAYRSRPGKLAEQQTDATSPRRPAEG